MSMVQGKAGIWNILLRMPIWEPGFLEHQTVLGRFLFGASIMSVDFAIIELGLVQSAIGFLNFREFGQVVAGV